MHRRFWRYVALVGLMILPLSIGLSSAQPTRSRPGGPWGVGMSDLTEAQRNEMRMLLQQEREANEALLSSLRDSRKQLQAAVFADVPDAAAIEQLKSQIAEAQATLLSRHIDLQMRVAQILTPEQRQRLRERGAGVAPLRPFGRGPGFGPGGRGPRRGNEK